ncbi:MAG: RpiR family transcriptional regulator, partial [Pantoea agglomerans]
GENAASRIAQLNILDALFVAIAKKDLKRAEKNLMKTQHAVQDLREF